MLGFGNISKGRNWLKFEDSNVGYQEVAVPAGYCMRTPTFRAMSGDYKISDFQVKGEVGGVGNEYAQIVNSDGSWAETAYYYLTEDGACVPTGWYKDAFGDEPVTNEDVLSEGQAVFFASDSEASFVFAGQVADTAPSVSVPAGYCMVGNPTPLAVKFSDIIVDGDVGGVGNEYAQLVNDDGSWADTAYYYLTEDGACVDTGWYKDAFGDEPVTAEDVMTPGEAVFFAADTEFTMLFPKAL